MNFKKTFKLKEPINKTEFYFETPFIVFDHGHNTFPFTKVLHETQHVVDLFSLYPSPLINSLILNFLLLKAIREVIYKQKESKREDWVSTLNQYVRKQGKIRNEYYKTGENDDLTKLRLDALFETTALEKQFRYYKRELDAQNKENFGSAKITSSTELELIQYLKKIHRSNTAYSKAGNFYKAFYNLFPDTEEPRALLYGNALPIMIKSLYPPPNLGPFFNGDKSAHEVFPIAPALEKINQAHRFNATHLLSRREDTSNNAFSISKFRREGLENCEKWIEWSESLKARLREALRVDGQEVFLEESLEYLINLPLDNIKRANKLEKIFIGQYDKDRSNQLLLGFRNELMLNNSSIAKTVPGKMKSEFDNKRTIEGAENLITKLPELHLKNKDLLAPIGGKPIEQEDDKYSWKHWFEFLIFNKMAQDPEKVLRDDSNVYECPISEDTGLGKSLTKNCRNMENYNSQGLCKVSFDTNAIDLNINSCFYFAINVVGSLLLPNTLIEDEN